MSNLIEVIRVMHIHKHYVTFTVDNSTSKLPMPILVQVPVDSFQMPSPVIRIATVYEIPVSKLII